MFNFFIGMFVGVVIMDLLWAWKIGLVERVVQTITMKWKLYRARSL